MKLIKSQKKNNHNKQDETLYPKVKTFSRAYEYSHAAKDTSSVQSGNASAFYPDERPYPVSVPSVPESSGTAPVSFADPERIDLQDTLLTDESFVERFPRRHTSEPDIHLSAAPLPASEPEQPYNPEESEVQDESEVLPEPDDSAESEDQGEAEWPLWDIESSDETRKSGSDDTFGAFSISAAESWDEAEYLPDESDPDENSAEELFKLSDPDSFDEPEPFFIPDADDEYDQEPQLWSDSIPGSSPISDNDRADLTETGSGTKTAYAGQLFPTLETKGKTALTAAWQLVPEADGYDLYFTRSGESFGSVFRTLSPEETAYSFTDLDKKTVYKMRVSAFSMVYGQKSILCESDTVRCITGGSTKKYTNALSISMQEDVLELSVDEKKKINASVNSQDEDRQVLMHGGGLRYLSEDTSVATVSGEGKVRGVAPGSCRIFVIAANGIHSVVNVSVREGSTVLSFKKKKYSLEVGDTFNLKKKLKTKPDKEAGKLKWKSRDKEIAEVSKKGILTALKKGRTTVRVKLPGSGCARVKIRISAVKKPEPFSWENTGAGKKAASDKKWSYFA